MYNLMNYIIKEKKAEIKYIYFHVLLKIFKICFEINYIKINIFYLFIII